MVLTRAPSRLLRQGAIERVETRLGKPAFRSDHAWGAKRGKGGAPDLLSLLGQVETKQGRSDLLRHAMAVDGESAPRLAPGRN